MVHGGPRPSTPDRTASGDGERWAAAETVAHVGRLTGNAWGSIWCTVKLYTKPKTART